MNAKPFMATYRPALHVPSKNIWHIYLTVAVAWTLFPRYRRLAPSELKRSTRVAPRQQQARAFHEPVPSTIA